MVATAEVAVAAAEVPCFVAEVPCSTAVGIPGGFRGRGRFFNHGRFFGPGFGFYGDGYPSWDDWDYGYYPDPYYGL